MLDLKSLFDLLQSKEIINKAWNAIINNEINEEIISENFSFNGMEFRLKASSNGTFNIDYLHSFKFQLIWPDIEETIQFFKPLGFYYFDRPLQLALMLTGEHKELVKQQDRISEKKKLVNIYSDSNLTNNAVIAGFSAENKLVLNTLYKLDQEGYNSKIAEFDPLFLTRRYNYMLSINGLTFKYLASTDDSIIQVYLTDEYDIKTPILALISKNKLVIAPHLRTQFDKLSDYGLLSHNEI